MQTGKVITASETVVCKGRRWGVRLSIQNRQSKIQNRLVPTCPTVVPRSDGTANPFLRL